MIISFSGLKRTQTKELEMQGLQALSYLVTLYAHANNSVVCAGEKSSESGIFRCLPPRLSGTLYSTSCRENNYM